ncbi:MAG: Chaperone protein TorD [Pseudomonadota bacterium]|mgnify:FL=1|jgi:TorA maturation chaperone TorD
MTSNLQSSSALDEETARAEIYGLLSQLFYQVPSPDLLAQLRVAVTEAPVEGGFLEEPWRQVVSAARASSDLQIADEFNSLFGGVGKPEIYLFASHYISGFLNDKPVARLREDLEALGLQRDESMSETEDHFACLCEVMRYLIAGDDVRVANLTQQSEFFAKHIQPWASDMADVISRHPKAQFYGRLADFTQAFLGIEAQGFDLLT